MMTSNGKMIQSYFEGISQSLLVGFSDTLIDQVFWNLTRYVGQKVYHLNHNHLGMEDIETLTVIGSLGTAIATIILVILLWKTIKQFETTAKLSAHQMEF